jgi:hypothetical protein
MNFEDEPYVRLYTRKTLTHRLLGWEGRAVQRAMIDEFDAAGIFEIRGDAARCISTITEIPIEIVQVGLARLVETETWVVTARVITWPTYEEAQNCRRSDRLRQRESRRARSAQSVTDVTTRHTPSRLSQPVTASHPPSHPPSAPSLPSTHPPEREDPDARAPESDSRPEPATKSGPRNQSQTAHPPEVPGLTVVHPGPLQPSKREQELEAKAYALNARSELRHRFSPEFIKLGPTAVNQAEGKMLGLTDDEIWARWDTCKHKYFTSPFDDDQAQFSRELAFAKVDKEKTRFKNMPQAERDAFEMPGRERRPA